MIQIQGIHKKFGKLEVLKGVDFSLPEGGVFAILGPNGSGKTTLLKIILGMILPDRGELYIDQQSVIRKWQYRKQLAYLSQIARFPENLTVKELIRMIADIRLTAGRSEALIELFQLNKFLYKKLGELSGGTRQKVNLVLTFMFDTPIYILDEPTAGLDPIALIQLKELIAAEQKKGKLILVTTHIMSLVEEIAEEIIFLLDGKIHFQGTVEHLKETTEMTNLEAAIAKLLST